MKRDGANSGNLDQLLRTAIHDRRLVTFALDGTHRVGEPHDYGIINGAPKLFFWQTRGESSSGRPIGWRWAVLAKISQLQVLDQRFSGPRPAPSGKHVQWDILFATVSSRPVSPPRA